MITTESTSLAEESEGHKKEEVKELRPVDIAISAPTDRTFEREQGITQLSATNTFGPS